MKSIPPLIACFLEEHKLPDSYGVLIEQWYQPLANSLQTQLLLRSSEQNVSSKQNASDTSPLLIGINGCQGSGKSTLAAYLRADLTDKGWHCAVLSIDDFYLTHAQRKTLAQSHHPLLATRGVPGTHDLDLLNRTLAELRAFSRRSPAAKVPSGQQPPPLKIPRFDKSRDDRSPLDQWFAVENPVDVILLEGWCVGVTPEHEKALVEPLNALEAELDSAGHWRQFVNSALTSYQQVFAQQDLLIMLKAPSFAQVYEWRLKQENKLSASLQSRENGPPLEIMSEEEIRVFIQHYQRLTEHGLREIPSKADWVFYLDENQQVVAKLDRRD